MNFPATTPDPRVALDSQITDIVLDLQTLSDELNLASQYESSCMDPLRLNASVALTQAHMLHQNYLTPEFTYEMDVEAIEMLTAILEALKAEFEACKLVTTSKFDAFRLLMLDLTYK